MTTEIQWTWKFDAAGNVISKGRTWNFLSGCDKVSPACRFCYAERVHNMRHKAFLEDHPLPAQYAKPFSQVQIHESRMDLPVRWGKPCRIFVNSMSDTFHDDVPLHILVEAFATMAIAKDHTFLVLTKRIARALEVLSDPGFPMAIAAAMRKRMGKSRRDSLVADAVESGEYWPLKNVAIGASAENQEWADKRIPDLLATPARWRFLSCEPLLGDLDLSEWTGYLPEDEEGAPYPGGIDWVIDGGESDAGKLTARPTNPDYFRSLRDQCLAAEPPIPYFHKQNGEWVPGEWVPDQGKYPTKHWFNSKWEDCDDDWQTEQDYGTIMYRVGKKKAGRLLDGVEHNQFPEGM